MTGEHTSGCSEYARLSRRDLLHSGGALALGSFVAPRWFAAGREGAVERSPDVLVTVFLRGGMDGLTACPPHGDDGYYEHRPTLAIARPRREAGSCAIDFDGFFGLAPSARALLPLFREERLAIVHASGSVDPTRSHFDAMKFMESGTLSTMVGSKLFHSGWVARHLAATAPAGDGLLRAVVCGPLVPRMFAGAPATLPVEDPARFEVPGEPEIGRAIADMYADAPEPLAGAARSSFGAMGRLAKLDFSAPSSGDAPYPDSRFGRALHDAAVLVRGRLGIECIHLDFPGWDDHAAIGPLDGKFAKRLDELSRGLLAFDRDLGADRGKVTVVCMSEFGRRVAENGSVGTEHGHGNCMFVLGGNVRGGKVYGRWPGLGDEQLTDGDLRITTDYRDVLGEVVAKRMQDEALDAVFPRHAMKFPGITRG